MTAFNFPMQRPTREQFYAVTERFSGDQHTVARLLEHAFVEYAELPFLDFSGDAYTYRMVAEAARRLAHAYRAAGAKPGERIVSILDNSPAAAFTFIASVMLDAIAAPLNTALKGRFLAHPINETKPAVVICEAHYVARLVAIEHDIPSVRRVLVAGDVPEGLRAERLELVPMHAWQSDDDSPLTVSASPTDVCLLIYTAGTTGPAKGCMISNNYLATLAQQQAFARPNREPLLSPLPLAHINPIGVALLGTANLGGRAAFMPRFSVSRFWPEIQRTGAQAVTLLGSMVAMLAEAPDNPASLACKGQLKIVQAAPFPRDVQKRWLERFGVGGREGGTGYGLTEVAGVTVPAPPSHDESMGKMHPFMDVRILGDDDQECPDGTVGEICLRPRRPNVMFSGYWNRPDATAAAWRNGFFHTGDLGRRDADGSFWFVDRKKDYLRRRGENISSTEMEATLREHPALMDAAVHAVKSDVLEDDVKVTAVRAPGAELTEQDLCAWLVTRVPYFAVPRYIEFRSDLPRNAAGRVLKYELREQGCTASTWDREASGFQIERR